MRASISRPPTAGPAFTTQQTRSRHSRVVARAEPARRDVLFGAATAATALATSLNPARPAQAEEAAAAVVTAAPPPPAPVIDPPTTHTAYLDLSVGGKPAGRVNINLFGGAVPKTVANFLALAGSPIEDVGRASKLRGKYKGSIFHRLVKGDAKVGRPPFVLQGGDFTRGNGTGGESIYGWTFADETFYPHGGAGAVSMANKGPNTGGSQFFITLSPTPWLDGKHVVFGRVDDAGMSLINDIVAREEVDFFSKPRLPITIVGCGLVEKDGVAAGAA